MKTVTQKLYLVASPASWEECGYMHYITSYAGDDVVVVDTMEVTMEIPEDFDINSAHIDILKAEKSKIQAEAHLKAENLEMQIQELMMIEHKPENDDE